MIATHGGNDPLRQGIPNWGIAIGWAMFWSSMIQVPFWVCLTIHRESGTLKEASIYLLCVSSLTIYCIFLSF